jgi:hypothetical protein
MSAHFVAKRRTDGNWSGTVPPEPAVLDPDTAPHASNSRSSPVRQAPPLWNPATGRFDRSSLRLALVRREWTPETFAVDTRCGRSSVYKALQGQGVRDRTAIAILRGLAQREPRLPRLE